MKPTILIILGMHRSGTSCLAKCLSEMGVNFHLPAIKDGYWEKHLEYYQVNQLNDQILVNWKKPNLDRNKVLMLYNKLCVKRFIKNVFTSEGFIGLKDPRLCLTFDYWMKNFRSFDIKLVGIFRRPEEVGKSLEIRDDYGKTTFENGVELWKVYNERLLQIHHKYDFPLLDFNLAKFEFGKSLEKTCCKLKIKYSEEKFLKIFHEKARHHFSENISEECRFIYSELLKKRTI